MYGSLRADSAGWVPSASMRIDMSCKHLLSPDMSKLSLTVSCDSLSKNVTRDPVHPHEGIAKFNLLGKIVYTVGGTDQSAIRTICTNKDLSFSQGNQFLFAGIAGAGQKGINEHGEMDAEEKKEMKDLAKAISPQRMETDLGASLSLIR